MANKTLRTRIAQKYDSALNWKTSQLVLLKGEFAVDELNRIKIGDGIHTWSGLPFAVDGKSTAISFLPTNDLPDVNSENFEFVPGNLALTPNGLLWCLVPDGESVEWVDLTNKSDIDALQAALFVLQNELNTKTEALQSAIVALQEALENSFASDLEEVKEQVAVNKADIAANKVDIAANAQNINTIFDSQSGKIKSAVLPSFVDDVVEGIVCVGSSDSEATYKLTHNGDAVIGFFGASGAEEAATRALSFISVAEQDDINLSTATPYQENGITYTFPAQPVASKIAPSSSVIYVDVMTNKTYRWSGSQFVVVASDLALGITSSSAFYGDKGNEVYNEVLTTTNEHTSLKDRVAALETKTDEVYDEVFTAETGLKDRTTALEGDVEALKATDAAHDAAIVALNGECASIRTDLENEFAAGILALKEESEQKDAAHDAAIVALQQQIGEVNESASAMGFSSVLDNTPTKTITVGDAPEEVLDIDLLIFDCGDASMA